MGTLFRLLAVAMTLAFAGIGQAQASDDDEDAYYYSYRSPLVYYRSAHDHYRPAYDFFRPRYDYYRVGYSYYRPYYYNNTYRQGYGRVRLEPGYLPGVGERTHDRTGTLPGVSPRYPQDRHRYASDYGYGYGYGRPSTCGRYHYARHGYCADARWRPPFKRHYPIYRYVTVVEYD